MYAAASWTCLRVIGSDDAAASSEDLPLSVFAFAESSAGLRGGSGAPIPGTPICTGVAAPRLVPGAIAATWLAYRM